MTNYREHRLEGNTRDATIPYTTVKSTERDRVDLTVAYVTLYYLPAEKQVYSSTYQRPFPLNIVSWRIGCRICLTRLESKVEETADAFAGETVTPPVKSVEISPPAMNITG